MVSIPSPFWGLERQGIMPSLREAHRARHADAPRKFNVVVRGDIDRLIAADLGWDDAENQAGKWNRKYGTPQEWAWIVPASVEDGKGVAA